MIRKLFQKINFSRVELAGDYYELEREKFSWLTRKFEKLIDEFNFWKQRFLKSIINYIHKIKLLEFVTAPVIFSCLIPALLMDLALSIYQAICFPIYGIPKVKRKKYIVNDRHHLSYLGPLGKIHCAYCGYFNGLAAYMREIGARTEKHWCPIRHAKKPETTHPYYKDFMEYGDRESYLKYKEKRRIKFNL
jgi:hypothetical protein